MVVKTIVSFWDGPFLGITRWWFQIFFMFTPIWGRFPIWLIFFRWVGSTTNQIMLVLERVPIPGHHNLAGIRVNCILPGVFDTPMTVPRHELWKIGYLLCKHMGDIEDLHIMQKQEQNDLLHRDIFNKQLLIYIVLYLYTYMSHSHTACTYTICKTTHFKSCGIFRAFKL